MRRREKKCRRCKHEKHVGICWEIKGPLVSLSFGSIKAPPYYCGCPAPVKRKKAKRDTAR